jgi:hypothetical protein
MAVTVLALAGCSFAPDPADAQAHAAEIFDDLVAELSAADPTVIRTVEVLPEASQECDGAGEIQQALTAQATLSVRAASADAAETLNDVATALGDGWDPVPASSDVEQRAWTSADGVVVALTNADPVLLVSVFPPCAARE